MSELEDDIPDLPPPPSALDDNLFASESEEEEQPAEQQQQGQEEGAQGQHVQEPIAQQQPPSQADLKAKLVALTEKKRQEEVRL